MSKNNVVSDISRKTRAIKSSLQQRVNRYHINSITKIYLKTPLDQTLNSSRDKIKFTRQLDNVIEKVITLEGVKVESPSKMRVHAIANHAEKITKGLKDLCDNAAKEDFPEATQTLQPISRCKTASKNVRTISLSDKKPRVSPSHVHVSPRQHVSPSRQKISPSRQRISPSRQRPKTKESTPQRQRFAKRYFLRRISENKADKSQENTIPETPVMSGSVVLRSPHAQIRGRNLSDIDLAGSMYRYHRRAMSIPDTVLPPPRRKKKEIGKAYKDQSVYPQVKKSSNRGNLRALKPLQFRRFSNK